MLPGLSHITISPLPIASLIGYQSLCVRDTTDQVLFLLPDRAPYRYIIKPSVHDPAYRHALFQRTYSLTHLLQPPLNFQGLADKILRYTGE
jgi:hypothetical protein